MIDLRHWIDTYLIKYQSGNTSQDIDAFLSSLPEIEDKVMLKGLLDICFAEPELSIPILRRVLTIDPKDAQAWAWLGDIYWLRGEDEKSIEMLEFARKINPDLPEVRGLGETLGVRW